MSTGFTLERSIFSDGHLVVAGNVGYGGGFPTPSSAPAIHVA